jgi:hypothetical protein
VTHEVDEVRRLARAFATGGGIEKWITPAYLRWYAASPAREHRFAGVIDADGCLSTYVMMARTPVQGFLKGWSVVDWFTTEPHDEELRVLLSQVLGQPEAFGLCSGAWSRPWLLRLTAVEGDSCGFGVTGWWRSAVTLNHLHRAPLSWGQPPKRWVLAEGDLGL